MAEVTPVNFEEGAIKRRTNEVIQTVATGELAKVGICIKKCFFFNFCCI